MCKQYPAVFDLGLRGFAPLWLKNLFDTRMARYEMRHECSEGTVKKILIASGCFMFFRRTVWDRIRGFDPGFFIYFEDFDISIRAGKVSSLAYVPSVKIIHFGGNAARKGIRHVMFFLNSGLRFYRIHGLCLW